MPKTGGKTRAVIYDRVSVRDDESQAEHLSRCRSFAAARGWEVVAEHVDTASGFSRTAKRPGWDRVQDAVAAGEVDAVVVFAVSRAGRNLARFAAFVEDCRDRGVVFASATEPIDTSGEFGRVFLALLSALAEMESATKRERTLVGRAIAERNGTWTGGRRRFGLMIDDDNRVGPHPTEGPLVKKAARDLLNGRALRAIARDWNAAGATTTGGKEHDGNTVRDILGAASNVPHILTKSDHRRVVETLARQRTGLAPDRYPLAGLLRCAVDGEALTARGGGRSRGASKRDADRVQPTKYVCQGPGRKHLHMTVDATALEEFVLQAMDARPTVPVEVHDPSGELAAERERIVEALEALGDSSLSEHVLRGRERKLLRDLDDVEQRLAEGKPGGDFWSQNPDLAMSYEERARLLIRRIVVSPAGKAARRFDPARVKIEWNR